MSMEIDAFGILRDFSRLPEQDLTGLQ